MNIKEVAERFSAQNFEYVKGEYKNLSSLVTVKCSQGHEILLSLKKLKPTTKCPVCEQENELGTKEEFISTPPQKKGCRILALDNATHITGFAVFENGDFLTGGIKKADPNKDATQRISEIRQWMVSMIQLWEIDLVGLEGVQLQKNNPQTLILLSKLLGVLEVTVFEMLGKLPEIVSSNTWKSHSNIKGRNRDQQKENVQKVVEAKYGIVVSQDYADAILLGRYLAHKFRFGEEMRWN